MKVPSLTPVQSSAISALGYDHDSRRLYVRFPDGSVRSYANVSPGGYEAFLNSASKGSYYRKQYAGTISTKH